MKWEKLLSAKRFGAENYTYNNPLEARSQFQRDYDRLIFSAPFRRLQNKTQVFPLPSSIFVHNRLTHSLEVASVGRSLGTILADKLQSSGRFTHLFANEIGSIVSAACLAHDLGNPPFGHSGESAISYFFQEGKGASLKPKFSEKEWNDLTCFEGNANALRLLTHSFNGRREGGYSLTYSTVASIVKYPHESGVEGKKKYGFFQTEKATYQKIAAELGLPQKEGSEEYVRHPLVYLVEAADDICYQTMDIEDAYKLKILTFEEIKECYLGYFQDAASKKSIERIFGEVSDANEQIAYLRSKLIGKLVYECSEAFWQHYDAIMEGTFSGSLIDAISVESSEMYKKLSKFSLERIYRHQTVLEIELSGYQIINDILNKYVEAILNPDTSYSKSLLALLPIQYRQKETETPYRKVQAIIDFVSGMTDNYALNLYRTLEGIQLPYSNNVY